MAAKGRSAGRASPATKPHQEKPSCGQTPQTSIHNYTIDFRRAHASGQPLPVPTIADLLANPAFAPLQQWLQENQVNLDDLQTGLNQFLAQAKQAALNPK